MSSSTDRTLRTLDAAAPVLTDEQCQRAGMIIERIVTTPLPPSPAPAPRPRVGRRLVLTTTAALFLAVAVVVLPGGRGGGPVYASWTATPTTVSEADLDAVSSACRRRLWFGPLDLDRAELVLAERRGDHVGLLYRTDDPDLSGSCVVTNPPGSGRVSDVNASTSGSDGPAMLAPSTGFTQGSIAWHRGVSITGGAVGERVVGVTIQAGDLTVETTVRNGRYVAWWPGPAFADGPIQPSGHGGPEPILIYDLTLDDGTVISDAEPARPS